MGYKRFYYNNGTHEKMITIDEIPIYEKNGYIKGRIPFSKSVKQRMSDSKRCRIHMIKDGVEIFIPKNEVQHFLNDGFVIGRNSFSPDAIEHIRESRRRYFKSNPNFSNSTTWKTGHSTWNKGLPMSDETKKKLSFVKTGRKLSENVLKDKLEKEYITKSRNKSFSISKPENRLFETLKNLFGNDNVIRHFKSERYPFVCDFYVKPPYDLFIELNYHWTHGGRFFNPCDESCVSILNMWKEKSKHSAYYLTAIDVWTKRDLLKLETATTNNLNYVTIFNRNDLNEFIKQFD